MTARRVRRMAARVFAVAAIALAVEVSAYVRPNAAENGGSGISPPGEERALSAPLASPEGASDAAKVALENELRRELLDDRAATLDWWLSFVGVLVAVLGLVVPLAVTAAGGIFWHRKFDDMQREAQEHLDAIRKDRDAVAMIRWGMNAEVASKDPGKAEEAIRRVRQAPNASDLDKAVADALTDQRRGDIDKAIEMWRAVANIALESDKERAAQAWFSAGYLSQKKNTQEHIGAAITCYNEAIRLRPNFPEAYSNRGFAREKIGKHEDAIVDYNLAIEIDPNNAEIYYNRASAKDKIGKYDDAIADYDQAIKIKPNNPEAYLSRGIARSRLRHEDAGQRDLEAGRRDLETAIDLAEKVNNQNLVNMIRILLNHLSE